MASIKISSYSLCHVREVTEPRRNIYLTGGLSQPWCAAPLRGICLKRLKGAHIKELAKRPLSPRYGGEMKREVGMPTSLLFAVIAPAEQIDELGKWSGSDESQFVFPDNVANGQQLIFQGFTALDQLAGSPFAFYVRGK